MSFIKFITSKIFFKQLLLAVVTIAVLVFLVLMWLNSSTNKGEFVIVPELKGKSINTTKIELESKDLVMVIQDSANFNPDYPRFSVIEQDPKAQAKVKENRKIYITLNPSGYRKVEIPELIQRTFRQAKPSLEAIGFKVGKKRYIDNIGKDVVLGLEFKGKPIDAGTKLPKTSVIDLVLGNGNRPGSPIESEQSTEVLEVEDKIEN